MAATLDGLLRSIHPSVTIDRYQRQVNAAVLRTRPIRRMPRHPRDLMLLLAAFEHRMSMPERDRTPFPTKKFEYYARVVDGRLRRHYGNRGIEVAFQVVRCEGAKGLREIMAFLAQQHVQDTTSQTVGRAVDLYWDSLNHIARNNAARLYLRRFGHILSSDQRHRDPEVFARVLPHVLKQHPFRLRELSAAPSLLNR